jgi:5-methylthioadenosine/S-adenosylhomocysteine deaminase
MTSPDSRAALGCVLHRQPCSCLSDLPASPLRRRLLGSGMLGALSMSLGSAAVLNATGCASSAAMPDGRGRVLLKGGTVLTMDRQLGDFARADVLIDGGRIAAIGPDLAAGDAMVIDAVNRIVMPGFVDSHRHLWEGVLRNALPDGSLGEYLRIILGRFGPLYRPEDVYAGNLVSALGALNAGVTTVLDWSHVQNTPQHTDAAIAALRDSGMRAVFGYGAAQIAGKRWWNDNSHQYPQDLRRLRSQYFSSTDQLLTLALAASGPNFGTPEVALREWQIAREVGVRISTHLGVGPNAGVLEPLGRAGELNIPATYIHCNNLTETEWKMIADSGGTVSVSAQVEMDMGHGLPALQKALDHGIRPSLSVDVETSLPGDFFTQMRTAIAVHRGLVFERIRLGEKNAPAPLTARTTLEFATIEGARANGLLDKTGTLTPGKQADIIMLRTDSINVMPINDPVGAVVQGMDTSNVDTVFVAGRMGKQGGRLVGVDVAQVEAKVRASQAYLLSRASLKP